jgi:uncharacterized protein YyaL (SSP411 family)
MEQINKEFYDPQTGQYADVAHRSGKQEGITMCWGAGVQLSALVAAAKVDRSYLPKACAYANALNANWTKANGIGGYNPLPGKIDSPSDRYYDDNEWIILSMVDLYVISGQRAFLEKAEATAAFVLSGEDSQLGGGIYWHEPKRESKNACSNAPAVAALLRLYQATGKKLYFDAALRLYSWTTAHLQDPTDGLYWDNIKLDGRIDKWKLSYNTALMIRSDLLFYTLTKRSDYLAEAKRLGEASVRCWVDPENGVIKGAGKFSHLLLDAFIDLRAADPGNPLWAATIERCVVCVHDHLKDPAGHYPEAWDHPLPPEGLEKWTLIDQASAARVYWAAAAVAPVHPNLPGFR